MAYSELREPARITPQMMAWVADSVGKPEQAFSTKFGERSTHLVGAARNEKLVIKDKY
jgi:hypothetical protein